jgi:hypothetical protein
VDVDSERCAVGAAPFERDAVADAEFARLDELRPAAGQAQVALPGTQHALVHHGPRVTSGVDEFDLHLEQHLVGLLLPMLPAPRFAAAAFAAWRLLVCLCVCLRPR